MEKPISLPQGLLALSPLMVFLVLYLVLSLWAGDFYAVPITVAFTMACIYALSILRGRSVSERIAVLTRGAANESIMLMIWIFIRKKQPAA